MGETEKARNRRIQEGFFDAYCQGKGLDIGVGRLDSEAPDPITPQALGWDKDDGDATYLTGVPDQSFDFVYSSHCLEHLSNPYLALINWWRVLRPGGYLILYVPHRDLYEKKRDLPSRWNHDHKFFLLPHQDEPPYTLGLEKLVRGALSGTDYEVVYLRTCAVGWTPAPPEVHSSGEYSIEMVVCKSKETAIDVV